MNNIEVTEVRSIVVKINMSPEEWDPFNTSGNLTNREHKARLLNERVSKYAPELDVVDFYMNLSRFALAIAFGDIGVIIKVTEYIYNTRLVFPPEVEV